MKRLSIMLLALILSLSLVACSNNTSKTEETTLTNWEDVLDQGKDKTVTILMWGGNDMINKYMDETIAPALLEQYDITLNRVPMNAPEYLNKLINEKRANQTVGNADLVWINAENFKTASQGQLLWGPFTDLLPNLKQYYNPEMADLKEDTGIAINGMEAIWGRAQFVLTTDAGRVENPPMSYKELLAWAKENPGRFTYPQLPDDFVGSAFVRGAIYELTGRESIKENLTEAEFKALMEPVMAYFEELHPYLWRQGKAFPSSQSQLDELFLNGEVDFTMGFELGKTAGLVAGGTYPETAYSYIFETGSIGNAHYLAIPFNAPEKAAALLTIDLLQSPKYQMEKFKASVWGDMPSFDSTRLNDEDMSHLASIEENVFSMPLSDVFSRRLPELHADYINYVEKIWIENFGQ